MIFDKHWRSRTDIPEDVRHHLETTEQMIRAMEYAPAPDITAMVRNYLACWGAPPPRFERVSGLEVKKGEYHLKFVTGYGFNWERWRAFKGDIALGELDCAGHDSTLEKVLNQLIQTGGFPFHLFGGKTL